MPLFATQLNFGYPWWLSYGHLPIVAFAVLMLLLGYVFKWSRWPMILLTLLLVWSCSAFLVTRFAMNINGRATLPTESFLRSGTGRVLDIGAGTGRSSIMVLEARPQVTLVASDLFGESFDQHFGPGDTPQQRLLNNLKLAGVDQRATIATADMRKLPFDNASFDGVVSAYAMDHLDGEGSTRALAEAARVLKPGGDFLLILVAKEPWLKFAFGPLLAHARMRGPDWWASHLKDAGFQIQEQGTRPATLYLLARRS